MLNVILVIIVVVAMIILVYSVGLINEQLERVDEALIKFEVILENSDVEIPNFDEACNDDNGNSYDW